MAERMITIKGTDERRLADVTDWIGDDGSLYSTATIDDDTYVIVDRDCCGSVWAKKLDIIIPCDYHEAEQFCDWLIEKGHEARVSKSTSGYVDARCTLTDKDASATLSDLWDEYCNE